MWGLTTENSEMGRAWPSTACTILQTWISLEVRYPKIRLIIISPKTQLMSRAHNPCSDKPVYPHFWICWISVKLLKLNLTLFGETHYFPTNIPFLVPLKKNRPATVVKKGLPHQGRVNSVDAKTRRKTAAVRPWNRPSDYPWWDDFWW